MKMFVGNGPDLDDSDGKSEKYHLTGETYYLGYPASGIVYIGYFVLVIAMANLLIAVRHKCQATQIMHVTPQTLKKLYLGSLVQKIARDA